MKIRFLCSMLFLLLVALFFSAEARTWTAGSETCDGEYLRTEIDCQTIRIKTTDGKLVRVKKGQLSQKDQDYLDSLKDGSNSPSVFEEINANTPDNMEIMDPKNCFVLLIGINKYVNSDDNLYYCESDMKLLAEAFETIGVPKDQIFFMTSTLETRFRPTKNNIINGFKKLTQIIGKNATLFVVYGGHVEHKNHSQIYLRPEDGVVNEITTLISRDEIFTLLSDCKAAHKVFMVDASFNMDAKSAKRFANQDFILFTSCGSGLVSSESLALGGHGVFTYFLAEGLKGKAAGKDGIITAVSLYDYAAKETQKYVYSNNYLVQQPALHMGSKVSNFQITKVENPPKPQQKPDAQPEAATKKKAADKKAQPEKDSKKKAADKKVQPEAESKKKAADKKAQPEAESKKKAADKKAQPEKDSKKKENEKKAQELYQQAEIYATADHGKGKLDMVKAIACYQKAADLGHPRAMVCLGSNYYYGTVSTRNYKKALNWFHKAADLNEPLACILIGNCYQCGVGVPENETEAQRWYDRGFKGLYAQKDDGTAYTQSALGLCYLNGYGVTQNLEEAVKWFRMAAEQNDADAQSFLGLCYQNGLGVPQNSEEAVKWFQLAAMQWEVVSQCDLGWCYQNGIGVKQDYAQAVNWYRKSAQQKNPKAQHNLGWCYQNGLGVKQDYAEAIKWYRLAAEKDFAPSLFSLGEMYENGYGVEKNEDEAISWYRKSAAQGFEPAKVKLQQK